MERVEEENIVIVGGGICGLATALALHRKGIPSIVLESSEELRATGAAIIMQANGWRALDQLGIAYKLRQTAVSIQSGKQISVKDGKQQKDLSFEVEETRCLRRTDLINALAENLPVDTIRLRCNVVSINSVPSTCYSILQLQDGSVLRAKVVIGCDGVNSTIASAIGLNSTRLFSTSVVRGFTNYEGGHEFGSSFLMFSNDSRVQLGLLPVTHNRVYWFVTRKHKSQDSRISESKTLIKESTIEAMKDFPIHIIHMMMNSDVDSLHMTTKLRFRPPWALLRTNFCKGRVTVAGDALHAMSPFIGQGGAASLEDAIVLARCLSQNQNMIMSKQRAKMESWSLEVGVEAALEQYAEERRMRVLWLSLEAFLIGTIIDASTLLPKALSILFLMIFFRDKNGHTRYDCGRL